MQETNLVVGAGLSGATVARLLADLGEKVMVIDKRCHIAGNCYDYRDCNNIMIHKYGSHIFHTNDEEVWDFVNRFADFNCYEHKVRVVIDGIQTVLPFNLTTLHDVFLKDLADRLENKLINVYGYGQKIPILEFKKQSDPDLLYLADYVYEKVFLHYTMKQWGFTPKEVDGEVTARVPVYVSRDDRYFQDKHQGIPTKGYTEMVGGMLNHPMIDVRLNTDYNEVSLGNYKRVIYTGSIDEFCGYVYGELPYRSVRFEHTTMDCNHYLPVAVVNYPCDYDYTRVHEFKYYLEDKSEKTVITKEYPEQFVLGKNDRYYPIPKESNRELYQKYLKMASRGRSHCYFLGRLGDYNYYDMDKAIKRGIKFVQSLERND